MANTFRKRVGDTAVWIILGLLIIGLMGFSVGNFGSARQAIGQAGDKPIYAQTYFDALRGDMRRAEETTGQNISLIQAQASGLQQASLQRVVTDRALENEAANLGLSVGDASIRDEILAIPAFRGIDGEFDRARYADRLQRNGQTEETFETALRESGARELLQTSVLAGVSAPQGFVDTLLAYANERRDFTWAKLTAADLATPVAPPTEADLQAHYEANPDAYTLPETKKITYVWLTPDMILDSVEVDEAAIEALYAEREADYNQPERRLVERLVFPNPEAAAEAKSRIDAGDSFDAEVKARGLSLTDVDMGDVLESDLGAAGTNVFAAEALEIVGPLNTSLGPALFRVNAILPANTTSLEDARPVLQNELAQDRARRVIDAQIDGFENELAAGAEIEELAETSDLVLDQIDWFPGVEADIAAYAAFGEAAAAAQPGDFAEIATLDDGGVFALRVEDIVPPTLQPLGDVRDTVVADRTQAATVETLATYAAELTPQITAGSDMAALGLTATEETDMVRSGFVPETPAIFLTQVFDLQASEVKVIETATDVIIVRLDAIAPPADDDPDAQALGDFLGRQLADSYARDLYQSFSNNVVAGTDVDLNQTLINGLHAQIQ